MGSQMRGTMYHWVRVKTCATVSRSSHVKNGVIIPRGNLVQRDEQVLRGVVVGALASGNRTCCYLNGFQECLR